MKGDTRLRAAAILDDWLERGRFPDRQVSGETRDRAFLMEVVYGAVKWKRALEWILERVTQRSPEPSLRAHLLVALYQVFHLDDLEPYALADETVEAVKRTRGVRAAGFVNAVVRRALREREAWRAALARDAPLAVRFSHPDWLVARWIARHGPARAAAMMAWDNSRPSVTVRVSRGQGDPAALRARWAAAGAACSPHPARPDVCLVLGRGIDPAALPGWGEGVAVVQDASTLLAVDLVDPKPGERILDACAAPGGKLADLADRAGGAGITALDASASRLARVRENLRRLRVTVDAVVAGDLTDPALSRVLLRAGAFDCILVDAPCTNSGVLRRRPDARWRFSADALASMVELQGRLLEAASRLLKPDGRLVYSTCSVEPEEDGDRAASWVAAHPAWRCDRERLWLPGEQAADGAYAVRLRRGETD